MCYTCNALHRIHGQRLGTHQDRIGCRKDSKGVERWLIGGDWGQSLCSAVGQARKKDGSCKRRGAALVRNLEHAEHSSGVSADAISWERSCLLQTTESTCFAQLNNSCSASALHSTGSCHGVTPCPYSTATERQSTQSRQLRLTHAIIRSIALPDQQSAAVFIFATGRGLIWPLLAFTGFHFQVALQIAVGKSN